ncbi:10318_t:CDS:2 [Entrophospora sp. SA101]|nr:10318_t:CDS:2 [Entrophospora sp. SA101]
MPRGKKKPTRKNVTTACLECKKSKTKCTGNTPCGNCTKRVMNRCKACKNNIKDTDISKLEACGKCKTQASKSCEFPQEKPRRGPPPRQTNQKAINCITINRIDNNTPFDIKDKNIFGEGMLFDYTKGSMNIEEYNSVNDDSLFSEFIIFEEPISVRISNRQKKTSDKQSFITPYSSPACQDLKLLRSDLFRINRVWYPILNLRFVKI